MKFRPSQRRPARGFLLLVVVGILTVLMALCVGLLGRTASEIQAVKHIRERTDSRNMFWSITDWMIGCVTKDLFDPKTNLFDATKYVSRCSNRSNPKDYNWWYKPFFVDTDLAGWKVNCSTASCFPQDDAAKWVYLPADFFPAGSALRGRFFVQVMDPNAYLNVNDGLEDCNPTQCQMAHMMLGNWNVNQVERIRGKRLQPAFLSTSSAAANWENCWPYAPHRYELGFKVATRTVLWQAMNGATPSGPWQTTNTPYFGLQPIQVAIFDKYYNKYNLASAPGCGNFGVRWAHVDPDTGRSPVNVNTCERSGGEVPNHYYWNTWIWTLEGVFNIESLRRIVRIGQYQSPDGKWHDLTDPANDPFPITDSDKRRVEIARTKLAYQYQETLVRYFCATYDLGQYHTYTWLRNPSDFVAQYPYWNNGIYRPYAGYGKGAGTYANYYNTYLTILGASEAAKVLSYCKKNDNSETRFPYALGQMDANGLPLDKSNPNLASDPPFRYRVWYDLRKMCENNRNIATKNLNTGWWPVYTPPGAPGDWADGVGYVNVDKDLNLEILPGKLDWRTAAAIYDNMVPGKAHLFAKNDPSFIAAVNAIKRPNPYSATEIDETYDPLWALYQQRIGRDEKAEIDPYMDVLGHITPANTPATYTDPNGNIHPEKNLGKDITGANVPWRQLVFGPDWFSTELTTTTTNFVFVVHVQLVDGNTDLASPRIFTEHVVEMVVEVAPDTMVDTPQGYSGAGYPEGGGKDSNTIGLGYYRGGRPAHYKTVPTGLDSLDTGCDTLMNSVDPEKLPIVPPTPLPMRTTSRTLEWVDYRGVPPTETQQFYRQDDPTTGRQLKKRIVIRYLCDQNQGQTDGYSP